MLLADTYQLALNPELIDNIFHHVPTPQDLDGKTLKVSWEEEAILDRAMGMMWPAYISCMLTTLYQKAGHPTEGFSAVITFCDKDEGCLVTFKKA